MNIKEMEEKKRRIEAELKEIEAEEKKAKDELAKEKALKEQERKEQEERRRQVIKERPADWDKYIHVGARRQQVEVNGRKREQFVTGLGSYARDIKLAIAKYGEAIVLARGIAIHRASDLSQHIFLEQDNIIIKDIKIDHEDLEDEYTKKSGRKRRVAEIKIVLGKAGG